MKSLLFISFLTLFVSCGTGRLVKYSAFADSKWIYTDQDKTYEITFMKSGEIACSNSDDSSPYNDSWYEHKGKLHFFFNDKYSHYTGTLVGTDLVKGTAKNKKGKKWEWEMERMK